MPAVRVQIVRFTDESFPGWVECVLQEASGREWRFAENVPVLTDMDLKAGSEYPQPGMIACRIVREWTDGHSRKRCLITTAIPWDVEANGGKTQFEVFREQVESGGH